MNGSIETEDYTPPSVEAVRSAVNELRERFDLRNIAVYLASAGLLMGEEWQKATWPVAEEIVHHRGTESTEKSL